MGFVGVRENEGYAPIQYDNITYTGASNPWQTMARTAGISSLATAAGNAWPISIQYTIRNIQYTVYSIQYTIYNV